MSATFWSGERTRLACGQSRLGFANFSGFELDIIEKKIISASRRNLQAGGSRSPIQE